MENFTPISSFLGGGLMGLSAAVMLIFNGRIAGISGILGGLLTPLEGDRAWRLAFLIGMIMGALIIHQASATPLTPRVDFPIWLLTLGGFIVGVGTRMGSGCTSGHGVCGIARFSLRSISATLTFMFFGGLSVYLIRHVAGVSS